MPGRPRAGSWIFCKKAPENAAHGSFRRTSFQFISKPAAPPGTGGSRRRGIPLTRPALILGNSGCAHQIAQGLADAGTPVILATADRGKNGLPAPRRDSARVEIVTGATLISCRGGPGGFDVTLKTDQGPYPYHVSGIVVAESTRRRPHTETYGLALSDNVWSLSQLTAALNDEAAARAFASQTVVFLTGLFAESQPLIAREAMAACLWLQQHGAGTYLLTGNLKVAGEGLEALYRQARQAGVVFAKFSASRPDIRQEPAVQILFTDEVTRQGFRIRPDRVIIEEAILPGAPIADIAACLGLHTDSQGFLQTGNVHRIPVFTNRPGILAAGPARMAQDARGDAVDAANAVSQLLALSRAGAIEADTRAQIHAGQCIRCLTCYRLCPYRAVILNGRLSVDPDACQRCGICAAECPRGAIWLPDLTQAVVSSRIQNLRKTCDPGPGKPFIVAFCCSRSAVLARDMAADQGRGLPAGLGVVEVSCAGGLSLQHLLAAFQNGADGVAVLTCHPGNCHSEHGNLLAKQRVSQLHEWMSGIGLADERLLAATLAANMGTAFAEALNGFAARLQTAQNKAGRPPREPVPG